MRLTPTERDRLLIFTAAELARTRRARGLRLNIPEATALIADTVCEAARDGARLADAARAGASILGPDDVMPGVLDVVTEVKVEAVFDDGSRMVVVREPFGPHSPTPASVGFITPAESAGPELAGPEPAGTYGVAEARVVLDVTNTGEVPVSITSHFHFFEVNPRLLFDRPLAYGMRLAIAAGDAVRFEPSEVTSVSLTPIGGARVAIGFAGLVDGRLDAPGVRDLAIQRATDAGYLGAGGLA